MPEVKQFTFNDKQKQVIDSLRKGNTNFFLEGGVRSGKSVVASYIIDYICSHCPGMEAYVYRDTFESIRKDTHRIMEDKPGFLNGKGTWKNGHKEFHYSNGSRIYFQYTKGGKHTLGQTAGLIYFEQVESMKEEDYDLILPRLSQWGPAAIEQYIKKNGRYMRAGKMIRPRNYLLLSANPKANWVKSRYIDNDGKPDIIKKSKDASGQEVQTIEIQDILKAEKLTRFHLSTYDNVHNLGDEYLAKMEVASDAFRKQYYDGSWEFNTGLIYPEFKNSDYADGGNVVNFEWEAENGLLLNNKFAAKNYRTIVAVDPGYVKSKFAALFCAVLPDNALYVFDEVGANGKNAEEWDKIGPAEFAKLLKEKYKEYGFTPSKALIDPAAKDPNAGMGSVAGQLLKAGIHLGSAKKTKEYDSIMAIKDLFKSRRILVNARCQDTIKELGLFAWDERTVQKGDQKPLDEDNDFLDCLRYIVNESPHPVGETQSYKQVLDKNYSAERIYTNWLKSWYGVKPKKSNPLAINNKGKGNWGI